jgi:hypothetical protein
LGGQLSMAAQLMVSRKTTMRVCVPLFTIIRFDNKRPIKCGT